MLQGVEHVQVRSNIVKSSFTASNKYIYIYIFDNKHAID